MELVTVNVTLRSLDIGSFLGTCSGRKLVLRDAKQGPDKRTSFPGENKVSGQTANHAPRLEWTGQDWSYNTTHHYHS
jgi:hypothetical protein